MVHDMIRVMGEPSNRKATTSSLDGNENLQQQYPCPRCNSVNYKDKKRESDSMSPYTDLITIMSAIMKNMLEKNQTPVSKKLPSIKQKMEKNTEHVVESVIRTDQYDSTSELITNEEKIKEIILKNTTRGESFYPDDLAFEHNMDLEKTMNVTCQLQSEGYVE